MAYICKTYDEWEVQANYGCGDGWECLCVEDSRKAVISRLKEYQENEGGNYRVVCKRVKIEEGEQCQKS